MCWKTNQTVQKVLLKELRINNKIKRYKYELTVSKNGRDAVSTGQWRLIMLGTYG
jgi:hypothetical protein